MHGAANNTHEPLKNYNTYQILWHQLDWNQKLGFDVFYQGVLYHAHGMGEDQ
jgi:hypothetical protein